MPEVFIPIAFFAVIAVVIWLFQHFGLLCIRCDHLCQGTLLLTEFGLVENIRQHVQRIHQSPPLDDRRIFRVQTALLKYQ